MYRKIYRILSASGIRSKLVFRLLEKTRSMIQERSDSELRILHQSTNFLVVDKPFDLIINSDDPERQSLHSMLSQKFPELVNPDLKVSVKKLTLKTIF